MTLFQKGNTLGARKKITGVPKTQSESVRRRRILDWLEWTTERNRKTIDIFFKRNDLPMEPKSVRAYISASQECAKTDSSVRIDTVISMIEGT